MNFGDFKKLVAAYMNRDVSVFVIGTVDVLADAINQAKILGQQANEFELCKGRAFIATSQFGAALSTATLTPSGGGAVTIKKINQAYLYTASGSDWLRTSQYNMISDADLRNILPALWDRLDNPPQLPITYKQRVYVSGPNVYLTGVSSPTTIWCDGINYLPDYSADSDTDFFLTNGRPWMLLKSIQQLNFFLKEDQRVAISNSAVEDRWTDFIAWDQSLAANLATNALD